MLRRVAPVAGTSVAIIPTTANRFDYREFTIAVNQPPVLLKKAHDSSVKGNVYVFR